jgi:hypothetical protein
MAAFATMAAAEARAYAKVLDKTWISAHAARKVTGTICVRVQRKMSSTSAATREYGAWTEITDDATA